ncbi:MAG: hypothetical protein AABW56_01460, partial [Nanoarchaeota archaeon]
MSIIPLSQDNFEVFTMEMNPKHVFSSGTNVGISGSVNLFSRRSPSIKMFRAASTGTSGQIFDESVSSINLNNIIEAAYAEGKKQNNISADLLKYFSLVNSSSYPRRFDQNFEIKRHPIAENGIFKEIITGSMIKKQIRNILFPYYRSSYSSAHFAYSNYHSLNFFTASSVPSDSVILYPNSSSNKSANDFISGTFVPTGSFTIEFYINPRYTTDAPNDKFHAGTILHLSSTYAVSLISGSSHDYNGMLDGFRILLQVSHSADVSPSKITINPSLSPGQTNHPFDLVYSSSDNSLRRNNWHHVAIRWGTNVINNGTGSFVIDGEEMGTFVIPSSSIAPKAFTGSGNSDVLCMGNFYEGRNIGDDAL